MGTEMKRLNGIHLRRPARHIRDGAHAFVSLNARNTHQCRGLSLVLCMAVWVILPIAGCATPDYFDAMDSSSLSPLTAHKMDDPRRLPMFTGDGQGMRWTDLLEAADWAEIIIIGEQHDDAMGHAFQLALMEDTLERWPKTRLSMEMLERDHQLLVDDYLDGYMSQETFVRRAGISRWGGHEGAWNEWFQPIVDAARDARTRVIAANAPRRFVRLARTHGYGYLRSMSRERQAYFDLPQRLPHGAYRERFDDIMREMRGHSDVENDGDERTVTHPVRDDAIEAMFRSQMMWDATMARSIVRARPSRDRKIVHLVGRFHIDFEGGLVAEIRRIRPASRLLTISMSPQDTSALHEADENRADIVVYTGKPSDEPDHESVTSGDVDDASGHD